MPPGAQGGARRACRRRPSPGLLIDVESSWGAAKLNVPLIGEFNADNALTVLAVLLAWDIPLAQAAAALESCRAAPRTDGGVRRRAARRRWR